MEDFVTLFLKHNADFETPTAFWRWSAYATIAAALRNNVFHNMGNDILYPNIYVLLLADSAIYRKGGAFPLVTELINSIHHTKLYDGRASIQAILEKLSIDMGGKKGIPIRGGSCIILAEELASFFVADAQLIPLITNIYRSRKDFTYDLRGIGFAVKNLCVTMLAASNEIHLRDVYDERAVYGGLLGRTFLVKPDERRNPNDLLEIDPAKYNSQNLVTALDKIKNLNGQVTFLPEAVKIYRDWYKILYKSLETMPDPAGIQGRIHTSILKLSIVLAAADYSTIINEANMKTAIEQATLLRPNYETYVMASGKSSQATVGAIFLTALWNATSTNGNKMSRKSFLMNFWNQVGADDLDKLIITLTQAGMVEEDYTGNEIGYRLSGKAREIFEKKKSAGKIVPNP